MLISLNPQFKIGSNALQHVRYLSQNVYMIPISWYQIKLYMNMCCRGHISLIGFNLDSGMDKQSHLSFYEARLVSYALSYGCIYLLIPKLYAGVTNL